MLPYFGYKFIPLSATNGAVSKPFENFVVLIVNASEEFGGQNYEQALALLQNNLTMTGPKSQPKNSPKLKLILLSPPAEPAPRRPTAYSLNPNRNAR